MSKLQAVTPLHLLQQQGNRNPQNGRSGNMVTPSLFLGSRTVLDEFKLGFPSVGLSNASNRWWGSDSPDCDRDTIKDVAKTNLNKIHQTEELGADGASSSVVDGMNNEDVKMEGTVAPQPSSLLSALRRKAAEEGRESLKLGVFKGYSSKKLGKRGRTLLRQIFESSLPSEWT